MGQVEHVLALVNQHAVDFVDNHDLLGPIGTDSFAVELSLQVVALETAQVAVNHLALAVHFLADFFAFRAAVADFDAHQVKNKATAFFKAAVSHGQHGGTGNNVDFAAINCKQNGGAGTDNAFSLASVHLQDDVVQAVWNRFWVVSKPLSQQHNRAQLSVSQSDDFRFVP